MAFMEEIVDLGWVTIIMVTAFAKLQEDGQEPTVKIHGTQKLLFVTTMFANLIVKVIGKMVATAMKISVFVLSKSLGPKKMKMRQMSSKAQKILFVYNNCLNNSLSRNFALQGAP